VLLDQQMPRHLTGPKCINRVYDAACGLDQDDARRAHHGGVGATTSFIPLAAPSTDYALGRIFFEDLGLVGYWRSVKSSDGTGVALYSPLPAVPAGRRERHRLPGLRQHLRRRLHAASPTPPASAASTSCPRPETAI
jgi:hypothetical protein